jgi:hypothetical protein
MNRTTTVVVALIAAAGLSTMAYTVPEQRALAWGGFGGCGFGCGGPFFVHKVIIQTISQTNNCHSGEEQKAMGNDNQDQNQKEKQVVCVNTATNTAGHSFGANGVKSQDLGNNVPSQGDDVGQDLPSQGDDVGQDLPSQGDDVGQNG